MATTKIKIGDFSSGTDTNNEDTFDLTSVATDDADIRRRSIYIRAENKWKYTNLALVSMWQIPKSQVVNAQKMRININGVLIKPSSETPTHYIYDFAKLRAKWMDLLGMTEGECDLVALEEALTYNQLSAMKHYTLTRTQLRGAVFSQELDICWAIEWKPRAPIPKQFEVIEDYYISDIHKTTPSAVSAVMKEE